MAQILKSDKGIKRKTGIPDGHRCIGPPLGWEHGSSSTMPAKYVGGPEFKPQYRKQNKTTPSKKKMLMEILAE
jgi:hypothetical protein